MTLTGIIIKKIIRKLLAGEDYRTEVITLIDAQFLQYAVDFFKRIAAAKLESQEITIDWYKQEMLLNEHLRSGDVAIHSGLNMKTISNMRKGAPDAKSRNFVLRASLEHYDVLYKSIDELVKSESEIDITLTIKFRGVSVDLNVNESLIVINTLAVKRAALRGGVWSTAGKQVEKPLMTVLCALYKVPKKFYTQTGLPDSMREVDFYLIDLKNKKYRCEVKLMGRGNPESADAVIARDSDVFIADTLSDSNKKQLNQLKIMWVELRDEEGYRRFASAVLDKLGIPYKPFKGSVSKALEKILPHILTDDISESVTPKALKELSTTYETELLVDFDEED